MKIAREKIIFDYSLGDYILAPFRGAMVLFEIVDIGPSCRNPIGNILGKAGSRWTTIFPRTGYVIRREAVRDEITSVLGGRFRTMDEARVGLSRFRRFPGSPG